MNTEIHFRAERRPDLRCVLERNCQCLTAVATDEAAGAWSTVVLLLLLLLLLLL